MFNLHKISGVFHGFNRALTFWILLVNFLDFAWQTTLKRALILCTENSEMVIAATALLYPALAAEFGTTSSRVASSISRAIGTAWNKGNREALNQYFNKTVLAKSRKPANAEFIAGVSDRLRLKLKIKMQG